VLLLCLQGFNIQQRVPEFRVKAAFLFNFSKFMEWPGNSFSTPYDPFVIGVYGKDPFGSFLDETIAGETMMGRPMIVERIKHPDDLKKCHILFINQPGKTAEVLNYVKGLGILTVSDDVNFCSMGGIIRFYKEKDMVRLQINVAAAKESNLAISSKLLRIAKICE
jgi:hypothetical protein